VRLAVLKETSVDRPPQEEDSEKEQQEANDQEDRYDQEVSYHSGWCDR